VSRGGNGQQLAPESIDSLQDALGTEHAALWCYSLAVAFLSGDQRGRARSDADEHLEMRGAVERILTRFGARAESAQPAYATPEPVTDARSAAGLLVVAETDAMAAWRSVLERSTEAAIRRPALQALTDATLRCARWRVVVGQPPAIPIFPGRPA
jgi:hypothetical protein